jgi:hypothetical protein
MSHSWTSVPGMLVAILVGGKFRNVPRQTWKEKIMSKVLVLYYSSYGHIEAMAAAGAEWAREAGAQVEGSPPRLSFVARWLVNAEYRCDGALRAADLTSVAARPSAHAARE